MLARRDRRSGPLTAPRHNGLSGPERVRQLTDGGVAVLYISHHLEEVFEICQDVAVLRDGELVLSAPTGGPSKDDLVAAMVGDTQTFFS